MPRPLKRGILGASTIILSKDIYEYAFICGSNFNEIDVTYWAYHDMTYGQILIHTVPDNSYRFWADLIHKWSS